MGQRRRQLERRRQLDAIEKLVAEIAGALIVGNPGTGLAVEAYEGLGKQVRFSVKARRMHIAHLLSLKDSLDRGASLDLIRDRVDDFLIELGIQFVTDTSRSQHFIFDCDEDGPEVVTPAVIDIADDGAEVTIREGHARRPRASEEPQREVSNSLNVEEPITDSDSDAPPSAENQPETQDDGGAKS